MNAIVAAGQQFVERRGYEYVATNIKTRMITVAARQRPTNLSSRAVKSRSATVPSLWPLTSPTTGRSPNEFENPPKFYGGADSETRKRA
jgi:hypothetical protein